MRQGDNFGALRLSAAITVIYGHCFPLSGAPDILVLGNSVEALAVKVFFVLSGYLITGSWLSDPNLFRYFTKRILRIFPALIFVVVLSAFILGPIMSVLPVSAYFKDSGLVQYFRNIALFPVFSLPGVFDRNIYPAAVNGALWSLPVEFSMYVVLPILVLWFRGTAIRLSLATLLLCWFSLYELRGLGTAISPAFVIYGSSIRSVLDVTPYFLIGATLRSLDAWIRPNVQIALLLGAAALLAPAVSFYSELALYIALPYVTIAFALAKPARFSFVDRIGDLSYGTYLFGFPIQQLVVQLFGTAHHPIRTCALALPPTLLMAFVSWHLIEGRILALKPRRSGPRPAMAPAAALEPG